MPRIKILLADYFFFLRSDRSWFCLFIYLFWFSPACIHSCFLYPTFTCTQREQMYGAFQVRLVHFMSHFPCNFTSWVRGWCHLPFCWQHSSWPGELLSILPITTLHHTPHLTQQECRGWQLGKKQTFSENCSILSASSPSPWLWRSSHGMGMTCEGRVRKQLRQALPPTWCSPCCRTPFSCPVKPQPIPVVLWCDVA